MTKKYYTDIDPNHALVDKNTGEIEDLKIKRLINLDEFIMIFLTSIPELMDLQGTELKVLLCCWKESTFNPANNEPNIVTNNKALKEKIRNYGLPLSDNFINKIICNLVKRGLLIKQCRGSYFLNPIYFFKGTLANRSKLELSFAVNPDLDNSK